MKRLDEVKAAMKSPPASGVVRPYKVAATVAGLDLPTKTLTLEGPRGNPGAVRVEDPENLKKPRLGESIVVTYTEAMAISLQKRPQAKKQP